MSRTSHLVIVVCLFPLSAGADPAPMAEQTRAELTSVHTAPGELPHLEVDQNGTITNLPLRHTPSSSLYTPVRPLHWCPHPLISAIFPTGAF